MNRIRYRDKTNLKNFDQNIIVENTYKNQMIKADIAYYNLNAAKILNNLKNKEKIFNQEYYRSFLPQIIIATYYKIINREIIENQYSLDLEKEKEIIFKTNNGKTGFFFLQILIYFISVYAFYKVLLNHFPKKYSLLVLGLLTIEPTINQYHSSFFTESIYISLMIVLLSLTLLKKKNYKIFVSMGLLLGLMYAQRSISIGLFLPIIIFLIITEKKKLIPIITIMISMMIVILFIGTINYKRSGIFYTTSYQSKTGFFRYVVPYLLTKEKDISGIEARKLREKIKNKWIDEHQLNLNLEIDRLKLYELKKEYSLGLIRNNFFSFIKYHSWKTLQTIILDPFQVFKEYFFDKSQKNDKGQRYWEYDKNYKKLFLISIIYSFFIYIISFIGLLKILKDFQKKKINFHQIKIFFLFTLMILYFLGISGWIGNPRYFTPCTIFLFFFTAEGILSIKNFLKKRLCI